MEDAETTLTRRRVLGGVSTLATTAIAGCTVETDSLTGPSTSPEQTEWSGTVVEVVDGDTLDIELSDGSVERVRLLGIDTPEVHTETDPAEWEGIPENESGRTWLRDWGQSASQWVTGRAKGEDVTIRTDPEADRRGSYDRLLTYVYYDEQLLNLQLIENGFARFYDSTFTKAGEFAEAEATAQDNSIGVWDYGDSTTTVADDGPISLVDFQADATGDDRENLNGEYVTFENTTDESLDMTDWTLSDEAAHTYTFPDGYSLDVGTTVTIYTGSGTDTEGELYWGEDAPVWNNSGDTITLRDASGTIVVQVSYS